MAGPASSHANPARAAPRTARRLLGWLAAWSVRTSVAVAQTALPQGGTVTSGSAAIGAPSGGRLAVRQQSDRAVIEWNRFSVGAGNAVAFDQPGRSAAILNRVTGGAATSIGGRLTANGQVFLVNPNGIAITPGGTVATGGGFVASTLGITNQDFTAGRLNFTGGGASAAVTNAGAITAGAGGAVVLLGGTVANSGTISVPAGRVGLGSGEAATLDLNGDGFLQVAIPTGTQTADGKALVDVGGRIGAPGGRIELRAATVRDAIRGAVNVSGVATARSVSGQNGVIVLDGGPGGDVTVSGRLSVTGGTRAPGGTIVTTGGSVSLTPTARLAASGTSGGRILIGGDRTAQPLRSARTTTIAPGAVIRADGATGAGGKIVVWSQTSTAFGGAISARGFTAGGSAEVSSHGLLGFAGTVDLTAAHGPTGTLLLDPYNVTISTGADSGYTAGAFTATGNNSVINTTTLQTALASANVTVSTGSAGAQSGSITLSAPLVWLAATTLTLNAAGTIALGAGVTAPFGGLTLTAGSGQAITATGAINVATFNLTQGNWTQNTSALPGFRAADFRIGSGASFLRATGGSGTTGSPYTLTDIYGVQGIGSSGTYLGNSFSLAGDIDASTTSGWNGGAGFVPIGANGATGYSGTFNGQNHAVLDLTINRGALATGVGLFGYASSATIENISLLNATVTGEAPGTGALAGVVDGTGMITNATSTGTVTGIAGANTGGLIGNIASGSITLTNSTSAATVNGFRSVGGLLGAVSNTATISISSVSASGAVTASGSGLVRQAGGLIGYMSATGAVTNAYATGSVTAPDRVGGLVGYIVGGSVILSNTFATGAVTLGGGTSAGGLVGLNYGIITNSYYNTTTTGQSSGVGSGSGASGGTGETTAAMQTQATFASFDFGNNWYLAAGYYPTLRSGTTVLGAAAGNLTISNSPDSATNVNTTTLQNYLAVGNMLASTTNGTITVANPIAWSNTSSLGLASSGVLSVSASANITASGAAALGLYAVGGSTPGGSIAINGATLSSAGGLLSIEAPNAGSASAVTLAGATVAVAGGAGNVQGGSTSGAGIVLSGATSLSASGAGSFGVAGTSSTGTGLSLAGSAALTTGGTVRFAGASNAGTGFNANTGAGLAATGQASLAGVSISGTGLSLAGGNALSGSGATMSIAGASYSGTGVGLSGAATLGSTGGAFSISAASGLGTGADLVSGASLSAAATTALAATSNSGSGIILEGGNTLSGTGSLHLDGVSTSASGVTVLGGNMFSGSGALEISGSSGAAAGQAITTSAGGTLTVSGPVTLLEDAGSSASMAMRLAGAIANTGSLSIDTVEPSLVSGIISGSGRLTLTDTGTVTVTGANTYTGDTTISAGTLAVGNGGSAGALGPGAVIDNARLMFNLSTALTEAGVISGTGLVTQAGSGTTSLSAVNTYTGNTAISAGALAVTGGGSLGSGSYAGVITDNGSLLYSSTAAQTFSGVISGTGSLIKDTSAASALTLSGANTYGGGSTLTAGAITVSSSSALGSGTITMNGGTLQSDGVSAYPLNNAIQINAVAGNVFNTPNPANLRLYGNITGSGTVTKTGGYSVELFGDNSGFSGTYLNNVSNTFFAAATAGSAAANWVVNAGYMVSETFTGSVSLGSLSGAGVFGTSYGAVTNFIIGGNNTSTTYSGNLTQSCCAGGSLSLTKVGTATLTLTGSNDYSGVTTISAGTLQIGSGGTSGNLGAGAVIDNANLIFNRSDAVTQAGAISGTGTLTQAGSGTTSLTGANTYAGLTAISAGRLWIGNGGTTGTLGTGPVTDNATLAFEHSDTITISNAIGGSGALLQAGTGTTSLTATNTYSGLTTIAAGTLWVGNGTTVGTLGTGAVTDNGVLAFEHSDTLTVANAIGGTGSLAQAGIGTTSLTGANTYAGVTTIGAGTLSVGNGGATGTLGTGAVTDNTNLAFNLSAAVTEGGVISGTGSLTQAGIGTTSLTGANTYTGSTTIGAGVLQVGNGGAAGALGAGAVSDNASLVYNLSGAATIANTITGSGNLTGMFGGALTVGGPISLTSGTVALTAASIALNNALAMSAGDLVASAGGITEGSAGVVMAGSLSALAAGSVMLGSAGNAIGTAAAVASAGNVVLIDTGALTIGTVNGVVGVSATAAGSQVITTGALMVTQPVSTTDASSGALVLSAGDGTAAGTSSGGDIAVSGAGTIGVGAGGTAALYTGSLAGSTGAASLGTAGGFRYDSSRATSHFTRALGPGLDVVYRQQPGLTVTIATGGVGSRAYDGSTTTPTYLASGLLNGDAPLFSGAISGGPALAVGSYTFSSSALSDDLGYGLTGANVGYTITAAGLLITAGNAGKTYGQTLGLGTTNFSTRTLYGSDTVSGVTLASPGAAAGAAVAGSPYAITASAAVGSGLGNYLISYAPGSLTVGAAPLTVTANNASRTYDGTAYSGGNGITASGFVNGETATVLTGSASYAGAAQGAVNAGSYTLSVARLAAANYAISYVPGTLTVGQAGLLITAGNASKTYGQTLSLGTTNFTTGTLYGGDTVSGVTLASSGAAAGASVAGSPYAIAASAAAGNGLVNYLISYAPGSLTVGAAPLTVTANNASRTYDATAHSGGNGITASGFVNGETASVLTGTASYNGTAQGAVNAGSYGLSVSGLAAANYAISYVPGTLTVAQAGLLITAGNAGKTYGQTLGLGSTNFTTGTLYGGDTVSGVTLASSGAAAGASVAGSPYAITGSAAVGSGLGNYLISYGTGSLTVGAAPLTVTANNASRTYDGVAYSGGNRITASGFVNGDTASVLTGSASYGGAAQGAVNAGSYGLSVAGLAAANYAISYAPGTLTVGQAGLLVTAGNASKTYGQTLALGTTNFSTGTLYGSDTVSGVTLASSGAAAGASVAGSPYAITGSAAVGSGLGNYLISYAPGSLTVTAAPLPTANDAGARYTVAASDPTPNNNLPSANPVMGQITGTLTAAITLPTSPFLLPALEQNNPARITSDLADPLVRQGGSCAKVSDDGSQMRCTAYGSR